MALKNIFNCFNSRLSVIVLKRNVCYLSDFLLTNSKNSKIYFGMKKAYFQFESGDKFDIKISFQEESFNTPKLLRFKRSICENVDIFISRLNKKLEHLLMKNEKKRTMKEKKNGSLSEKKPVHSVFMLNDEPLHDTTFEEIFSNKINGSLKLKILDSDYDVVINVPTIDEVSLSPNPRVGNPVYPVKFETKCMDINKSAFMWFKSLGGKSNWTKCGEGFFYIPTNDDNGHFLKLHCIPKNESQTGPVHEAFTSLEVADFFSGKVLKNRHKYTTKRTSSDELRVLSYNVLSDAYVHTKEAKTTLFTYCDPDILDFSYRKELLIFELCGFNADIMCLQEVDRKLFTIHLVPIFSQLGFEGVLYEKETVREGCAIFFHTEKFKLWNSKQHIFSTELFQNPILSDLKEKIEKNEKLKERLGNLSSQIQIGVLERLKNQDVIVLGNTHLYFHPDADHIRLLQGIIAFRLLLNTIENLKQLAPEKRISLLLCGDFNSVPECGIYHFITKGSVGSDSVDWKSNEEEAITGVSFEHSLKMESACGTPNYTNYTLLFKACLDYIYYQTDHLEVKQVVPLPSEEELSTKVAIPNEFFPSDHVALIADFSWKS